MFVHLWVYISSSREYSWREIIARRVLGSHAYDQMRRIGHRFELNRVSVTDQHLILGLRAKQMGHIPSPGSENSRIRRPIHSESFRRTATRQVV
jgi:hypothetical protein